MKECPPGVPTGTNTEGTSPYRHFCASLRYKPDYGLADPLVRGVHWGFRQGCAFSLERCVQNGATSFPRHWCVATSSSDSPRNLACNAARTAEVRVSTEVTFGRGDLRVWPTGIGAQESFILVN